MSQVKENSSVKVHYTGKLSDGQIFDSSEGKDPMEITLGLGHLIPGFEKGLVGMEVNEKKTISIPKEEAYGDVNPQLRYEVQKTQLPQDVEPQVGMGLSSRSPEGEEVHMVIFEIKEESVILDGNHPLAGKDLIFDLEVVGVTDTPVTV